MGRPPRSGLFPDTRLFRSVTMEAVEKSIQRRREEHVKKATNEDEHPRRSVIPHQQDKGGECQTKQPQQRLQQRAAPPTLASGRASIQDLSYIGVHHFFHSSIILLKSRNR